MITHKHLVDTSKQWCYIISMLNSPIDLSLDHIYGEWLSTSLQQDMASNTSVKEYLLKDSIYGDIYCPDCGLEADIVVNKANGEPYIVVKTCKSCQLIDFGNGKGWEKGVVG